MALNDIKVLAQSRLAHLENLGSGLDFQTSVFIYSNLIMYLGTGFILTFQNEIEGDLRSFEDIFLSFVGELRRIGTFHKTPEIFQMDSNEKLNKHQKN